MLKNIKVPRRKADVHIEVFTRIIEENPFEKGFPR